VWSTYGFPSLAFMILVMYQRKSRRGKRLPVWIRQRSKCALRPDHCANWSDQNIAIASPTNQVSVDHKVHKQNDGSASMEVCTQCVCLMAKLCAASTFDSPWLIHRLLSPCT
jgi:hypothetical protein